MSRQPITRSLLAPALLLSSLLAACSTETPPGWAPLWEPSWELLQVEDLWLRGITLEQERPFEVEERGPLLFRAHLANRDDAAHVVTLSGPAGTEQWALPPKGEKAVEAEVRPGRYLLAGTPEVVVGRPRVGLPLESPKLLVLLLADTLRDDHVEPTLTPGILEAFESGRRWTDVTANSPWTLPSVASMFTSRSPLDLSTPDGGLIGIPKGSLTFAQQLEKAGFVGGAAIANYTVHAQNGFADGFASFRVPTLGSGPEMPDASSVVGEGRRFLAAHRGEDAFLYLHFMDPHEPFRDHGVGLAAPPSMAELGHRRRAATAEERELLRTLYRGEVRHLDRIVAPFLRELPEHAVVGFVSDHGEILGEHGAWGHGMALYQEVVAVPLLLRGPGIEPGTVERPAQLLDLAPTLLEAVGVPRGDEMAGSSLLGTLASGPPRQPISSSTFSAGPLRWAWRDTQRKVVVHTAPQAGGAPGGRYVREDDPLFTGALVYSLPEDDREPAPLSGELTLQVARIFARSAGSLVPGVTFLLVGVEGPVEIVFDASGPLEPIHLWGLSPVEIEEQEGRWTVRVADAFPLAGVAFEAESAVEIRPVGESSPWSTAGTGAIQPALHRGPPPMDRPGLYLWHNDDRTVVVSGQQETERRLRGLGYL